MKIFHSGAVALQILSQHPSTRLMGITSRGMFLHSAPDWVIFLSGEPWRGPLTLNLSDWQASLPALTIGEPVSIEPHGLRFPQSSLWIAWDSRGPNPFATVTCSASSVALLPLAGKGERRDFGGSCCFSRHPFL